MTSLLRFSREASGAGAAGRHRGVGVAARSVLAFALLAGVQAALAQGPPTKRDSAAPEPERPWVPAPDARLARPAAAPLDIPDQWKQPGALITLPELIAVALRRNPATQAAWHAARAEAFNVRMEKADWWPTLELDANITRQKQSAVGGRFVYQQTSYGVTGLLSYLLLDLGGRSADVEEARQTLHAANWSHDRTIQDVVLLVQQAYYRYQGVKALAVAGESSLAEARKSEEASEERRRIGVATIADVLQARTQRSRVELTLQTVQGQIQVLRGAVATAVGLPASIVASLPVDVPELPVELDLDRMDRSVDALIDTALGARPDLLAARAETLADQSHVKSVRSAGLPWLSLAGTLNRTWYTDPSSFANNYTAALLFRWPVFEGGRNQAEIARSQERALESAARAESLEQQVIQEVWTAYYDVKTSAQRVRTARDLLASATQSAEVADGRYRAGVGSVLDLLTAQAQLTNARAEDIQARAEWLLALAQLAHDSGMLAPVLEPAGATP